MQGIAHYVAGNIPVGIEELRPDVEVMNSLAVMELRDFLVDLGDGRSCGIIGGSAGKDPQEQDVGLRKTLPKLQRDCSDSFRDFLTRVSADVVGANHQHHGSG